MNTRFLKKEAHKVYISKEAHSNNTKQAARRRRMNKKRGKFLDAINDLPLKQKLSEYFFAPNVNSAGYSID